MKIGEVCLETNDVIRMADFYRFLLGIEGDDRDATHQTLLTEETMLTIYNDGTRKWNDNRNITLAFTVDDVQAYCDKLVKKEVTIIEPPTERPWGMISMSFYDPDHNVIYLRQKL